MSHIGYFEKTSLLTDLETITGDAGGAVGADALFNLNLVGGNNITTTGTPGSNQVSIALTDTTDHTVQVGNATGSLTSLGAATNGQLIIGSTGADPSVAALTAGTGITITNAAGSITIDAAAGIAWSVVGASATLAVNTGSICTTGAALSFALPAVSAVGDMIELVLDGSTSWTITQAASQYIRVGSSSTTVGVGGSLASTLRGDAIKIVCVVANTSWVTTSMIGNLTIV